MKLLLDVHHSRHAAQRLREAGHDVLAAADEEQLRDLSDEDLLARATADERAVVTENARDFDQLVRQWMDVGSRHAGAIFTSPRRFHRGSAAYPENLVEALGLFLADAPARFDDRVHWL